jgi:undecaprenyl-diphosphatase
MEIWQAIVLGLVQGLTEFLPVSSSGHLVFIQRVLSIDIGGAELLFNIILHVGTLVAVCAVFYKDIINLFKKPFKTLLYLIVATIPAALFGFLFEDAIDEVFLQGQYVGLFLGIFFFITACVLFATEVYAKKHQNTLPLSFKNTIPMGLAQVVALLPGISRSGSTIAAGTFAGANRDDVSRFSFLMSIPIILGSFVVSLVKSSINGELAQSFADAGPNIGWCIAIGFIVAAVSGLFAIKVMLVAIKKANYKWFSLYLVLLAIVCIVLFAIGIF